MESNTQTTSHITIAMKQGAYFGVLFSANFLCSTSSSAFLQFLTYFITASIAVTLWRRTCLYRDKHTQGVISFMQVVWFIMTVFIFATLISALVKMLYLKYINPTYLNALYENSKQILQILYKDNMANYDEIYKAMLDPKTFILSISSLNIFIGLIIGCIYAPFIRRKEKTEE